MFKRIINHMIASITSQDISVQISSDNQSNDTVINGLPISDLCDVLTGYFSKTWERNKMTSKMREVLLDGALTGDYCMYSWFDKDINTGEYNGLDEFGIPVEVMGDICNDITDSVNVFFGNPNDVRVNDNGKPVQPYIIVSFREMTAKLKEEAKKNGISKDDIELIVSDTNNEYQAGDRGQIEIENSEEGSKTTAIVKMWVKDGTIHYRKSTKFVVIDKERDTKLKLYPLAWANWDRIKNSYHGQALGTGLVPNQLFINKLFAMAMISVMNTAYPKVIFDSTRIQSWSNAVGSAIGVDGDITNVAKYLQGGTMSNQVSVLIDNTINYTKEFLGATDAAMGNVKPENTSAIMAVVEQASVPLETIKLNMYQFIEDLANIWLDTMIAYYGERTVTVTVNGEKRTETIDFSALKDVRLNVKIDVGASSYWSRITSIQALDNLLTLDKITFRQYLERLPNGFINKRQELLKEVKDAEEQAKMMEMQQMQAPQAEEMAQFIQSLPQEAQAELMALSDEERYQTVLQLMQQPQQQAF